METHDIAGVEIFAEGEWNGDNYTSGDLDELVQSFQQTKEYLKPYLKLGHNSAQKLLASDELPAAGWITNLYREGGKLLADFSKVPKKIYELIKAGAYRRVSSEIFINPKVNGKAYRLALKAVAILGGETPAVSNLSDIHALYVVDQAVRAYEKEAEVKVYEMKSKSQEDDDMKTAEELSKELNEANAKVLEMTQKHSDAAVRVAALEKENVDLKANVDKIAKEYADAQAALIKIAHEKRSGEISSKLDKLVESKKINPAQKPVLFALLNEAKTERAFKVGEKEYSNVEDLVFAFIDSGNPTGLNTGTQTEAGKDQADLADQAKSYAEKNKVSYKDALIAVSKQNGAK